MGNLDTGLVIVLGWGDYDQPILNQGKPMTLFFQQLLVAVLLCVGFLIVVCGLIWLMESDHFLPITLLALAFLFAWFVAGLIVDRNFRSRIERKFKPEGDAIHQQLERAEEGHTL